MPNVRTLGSVTLSDTSKYRVPAASESENKVFEVVSNPIPNTGLINLGMADHVATELTMDVWVTGSTWQGVLTNYSAIQTVLDAAKAYSIAGTGTPVTYQEQAGNQASPTQYTVKYGKFTEHRARRLVEKLRMVGQLSLYCEPL